MQSRGTGTIVGGTVYTKYRGGQSQRMVSADTERTNRLIAAGPGGPNRPLLQWMAGKRYEDPMGKLQYHQKAYLAQPETDTISAGMPGICDTARTDSPESAKSQRSLLCRTGPIYARLEDTQRSIKSEKQITHSIAQNRAVLFWCRRSEQTVFFLYKNKIW